MANDREVGTAYLLWALGFLFVCGLHRLYLDRPVSGVVWLGTAGLCWIGQLIDFFLIPEMVRQRNRELAASAAPLALPPGSVVHWPGQTEPPIETTVLQAAPPPRASSSAAPPLSPEEQLQVELHRVAQRQGGVLTVSDGVVATGRPPREVQAVLDGMAREGYVDLDIDTHSGSLIYSFRNASRT